MRDDTGGETKHPARRVNSGRTNQAVVRRYAFALYPTVAQSELLHEHRRMMADLWNAFKQRYEDVHRRNSQKAKEDRRSLTFFDLTLEITELRRQCPEWRAMPAVTLHRVAKQLIDAFQAFFRRCRSGGAPGYPRWRVRDKNTSIPLGTGTRDVRGNKMWKTGWRFLQRPANPRSWSFYYGVADLKDRMTWIHARGRFPTDVNEFNNGDVIWRDGKWHLSLCVEQCGVRWPGQEPVVVRLDLIDCFALVNDAPVQLDGLMAAARLTNHADAVKSVRDKRWLKPPRRDAPDRLEWNDACAEVTRLLAKAARIRRNALHVWTSQLISVASDLTIITPSIRQMTASARGDDKQWGANIEAVAHINRHILNQAPALARAMLEYKAAEAGIRCDVLANTSPKVAVGGDLNAAGKAVRKARRKMRESENEFRN
jgi:putative transposase